ncbi:class I SAM-dependent methyltransferase [Fulvivirga kasyanovii]|uniref:Class I SAM-dependent methyltransferase n=1 Tax=Fulvivirga kasyanovii TaxID=396812 RepID=A0ABW9RX66_9BACT|nr:class I SAM-dependent methyltransferase [Fulvivirga kasyanovii]MTI28844.1 class I SAM-dependent methyltransferase [Fulvivirga kasyanovii]
MKDNEPNPFDAIAQEYDRWFDDHKNTFLSDVEAIKFFLPNSGKGLDIGAGTGRFAAELGIQYGIEPSKNMAQIAKRRGIDISIGKAENMPYPDEAFDFAILIAVDHFILEPEKAYREIFRVLAKEGKLLVGTLHKDGEVAQKRMNMDDPGTNKNVCFRTVEETVKQLKKAGFSGFKTCQTLLTVHPDKAEKPTPGHDKGSFVVIEALKATGR